MVVCSAIRVTVEKNGKPLEVVVPGIRHADCRALLAALGYPMSYDEEAEGFLNKQGLFLDRYEACELAKECGQLTETVKSYKNQLHDILLYSEDII